MSILRRPWSRQPQYFAGVNKASSLSWGLAALFDTRHAVEILSGARPTNLTSLVTPGNSGVAADFSGSANQQYAHRAEYAITGDLTIAVMLDIRALSNYGALIAKQGSPTRNAPYELRLGTSPTEKDLSFIRADAGGFYNSFITGSPVTADFSGIIIVRSAIAAGSTPNAVVNGTVYNYVSAGPSGVTDSGADVWIGRRYDGATQLDGKIYYIALWNRVITDGEAKSLNRNPWQLFAPLPRRIWAPAGGAGGNNGNLAATETGADTGALVGSVGVTGSLAASETGSETAALVAAVGVSGSLAATESGADTAALTGVVGDGGITADLAAVETGADSAVLVAAIAVSGDLAASESADTAAFTGEVVGAAAAVVARARGGRRHASAWIQARKRLALQTWIDYLTEEEPAESTKKVIKEIKAGRPIPDIKPPKGPESISAEKLADLIIPSRLWTVQNILVEHVELQRVVAKAIRIAEERDDEDVLMLL